MISNNYAPKFQDGTGKRIPLLMMLFLAAFASLQGVERRSIANSGVIESLTTDTSRSLKKTQMDVDHSDEQGSPALLNPFRDIKLSYAQSDSAVSSNDDQSHYSSHHCVSATYGENAEHEDTRFLSRTCMFTNLYYSPQDESFHYFPSPQEQKLLESDIKAGKRTLQDFEEAMTVSLGNIFPKDSKDKTKVPSQDIWHPKVHTTSSDPLPQNYAVISNPSNLALLLYRPFYSFNIGHFLWDDALSLFSMLDIFGLSGVGTKHIQKDANGEATSGDPVLPIPFYMQGAGGDPYYRCAASFKGTFKDRWEKCTKMYKRMFPSIFRYETHKSSDILRTGNWLKGMANIHGRAERAASDPTLAKLLVNASTTSNSTSIMHDGIQDERHWNQMLPNTSFVLVPTALAGIGKHGQIACAGDCSVGRASQLFSFREFLLNNILGPSHMKKNPAGYITFSLPVGSSRPKEVSFFEDIIPIAKELYGEDMVKVVDMAQLSFKEEALLALDTAVLFANHGGGSATSILLPRGSSVFLYPVGGCKKKGVWCDHKSKTNHFDSIFYESAGYIRPTWIHENERNDVARIKLLMEIEYEKTKDSWAKRGVKPLLRGNHSLAE